MSNFDKHADDLIGNMIAGIVEAQVAGLNAGADAAERRMIPALRTLEREYFAALIDPQTKMKTSLQLAILAVLMVVPSAITERVNDYANGKLKAEGEYRDDRMTGFWRWQRENGELMQTGAADESR